MQLPSLMADGVVHGVPQSFFLGATNMWAHREAWDVMIRGVGACSAVAHLVRVADYKKWLESGLTHKQFSKRQGSLNLN